MARDVASAALAAWSVSACVHCTHARHVLIDSKAAIINHVPLFLLRSSITMISLLGATIIGEHCRVVIHHHPHIVVFVIVCCSATICSLMLTSMSMPTMGG